MEKLLHLLSVLVFSCNFLLRLRNERFTGGGGFFLLGMRRRDLGRIDTYHWFRRGNHFRFIRLDRITLRIVDSVRKNSGNLSESFEIDFARDGSRRANNRCAIEGCAFRRDTDRSARRRQSAKE